MRPISHLPKALVAVLVALLAAGCGQAASTTTAGPGTAGTPSASLMLDFTPNAIHSGIYLAKQRRYDLHNGVDLQIRVPGQSTDAIALLAAGRINFGILDIHDLAIADAHGRDLVGLMAIVERPLASVIAQARFSSPRQLAGQTVGVTGAPSDLAVLDSIVAGAGGNPAAVKTITIGYDAVPDLIGGRVAAATAFWNDEGAALQQQRPGGFHIFRVEQFGAPPYPELVLCTTRQELRAHPNLARSVVRTLAAGYDAVLADPAASVQALTSQVGGLNAASVSAQLHGELSAFRPASGGPVGSLDPAVLRRWAVWESRFGIVKRPPSPAQLFDGSFVPR